MGNNIILIGMPGSGKSTLGKILARKTKFSFLDFDDDIIEVSEKKNVGELATELSQDVFIKLEEDLCLNLNFQSTIFSTSGSLPYSKKAMSHLRTLGKIVYLRVNTEEIVSRMGNMKTDRIIGLSDNDLGSLLKEREKIYTDSADIIFNYSGSDIDTIVNSLITHLGKS